MKLAPSCVLGLAALVTSALLARADGIVHTLGYPGVPDKAGPIPDPKTRFELDVGFGVGDLSLAHQQAIAGGPHVAVGVRFARLALLSEIAWVWGDFEPHRATTPSIADPKPIDTAATWASSRRESLLARFSLGVHRSLLHNKRTHLPVRVSRAEEWIELGVGHEETYLHPGASASRPVLSLGLGFESGTRDGDRHSGGYCELRVLRSRDPDGSLDHEVLVNFGMQLGN